MEHLKIFDEKFHNLIKNCVSTVTFEKDDLEEITPSRNEWIPPSTNNLSCSYCRTEFNNAAQQRDHYKLDWHRYNLKQSLLSKQPLTEEQFNIRTDDVSSISGSDSEEEETLDTIATAQGKVFLKSNDGRVFGLYRCLFVNKKVEIDENLSLQVLKEYSGGNNLWTVLMLGGGHFAGAIFQGTTPILHKTFHCYTVRAGQGGSQSARDGQSFGSQPKSAGASLRRYNEMSLIQHVRDIVVTWRSEMDKCSLIIYRAAGSYNKSVLFGGKAPLLDKADPRLRTIPFSTRRATFTEVKRVHDVLASVSLYDSVEAAFKGIMKPKLPDHETKRTKTKTTLVNRAKSRESADRPLPAPLDAADDLENKLENQLVKANTQNTKAEASEGDNFEELSEQEFVTNYEVVSFKESLQEFGDSLTPEERKQTQRRKKKPKKSKTQKLKEQEEKRKKELYDIVSEGNIEKLSNTLKAQEILESENNHSENEIERSAKVNEVITANGNTLLHVAAVHKQEKMVEFLLQSNADPCLKNSAQQTPYTSTQDTIVRDIFKKFAQDNPDKYNYNKAQIPISTIPPEELADKKRLQKKAKREKEKEKKKDNEIKRQEQSERDRFLQLSDREKRALAAERRILSQSGAVICRCFLCASDMSGKVPFEYLTNRFCSIECLKAHRLQNPIVLS